MMRFAALVLFIPLCVLLAGCADKPLAPIEDRNAPGISRVEQRYTVLGGDTLFSIAFRYGLDYRRLAAANAIASPYTIYPGQKLRLIEVDVPPEVAAAPKPAASAVTGNRRPTAPAGSAPAEAPTSTGSSKTAKAAPQASPVAPEPRLPKASQIPVPPVPSATPTTPTATKGSAVGSWRWPARGRVTRGFEKNLHKGIDIGGERGDPVLATAGGRVVYAGSGIAGYGLMLIVRHNEEYLSAYGHNDALLVDEGDVVRAGQQIAERGSSGTDTIKLHFEIRRKGRPVDPLQLLPKP